MSKNPLTRRLKKNPLREQLIHHDFFRRVKTETMTAADVSIFLGQWWHPLHYFTTFLARSIAVLPDVALKCAVSKILNEEAGEGSPRRAHEAIYVDTMTKAGFARAKVDAAAPFAETRELVAGYEEASRSALPALGFIFATEVADLAMVSGIGTAVRRATGAERLEWVDIHIEQEPGHVEDAGSTLMPDYSAEEEATIVQNAERMWRLWIAFFDRLENEVFAPAPAAAAFAHVMHP
jgi:hypothetical protein